MTVPGKRRWNWPRSISPFGSYAPRGSRRGGPYWRHAAGIRLEEIRVQRDVHDRREPGVRGRAVVALEEVLGGDLPVARELGLGALQEPQRVEVDSRVGDPLWDAAEEVGERPASTSGFTKISGPHVSSCIGMRPSSSFVDPALVVSARRGDETTVEAVCPRVIRALERLALARAFAHDRASVTATFRNARSVSSWSRTSTTGMSPTRVATNDPGSGTHLLADVLPRAAEDALALEPQHGRVRVPAPRQASDVDRAHGLRTLPVGIPKRRVASRPDDQG